MKFFSSKNPSTAFAAVIEIGSGSVLASIIKSDKRAAAPEIIWSKREVAHITISSSTSKKAKAVLSSLLNIALMIEKDGKTCLSSEYPGAKISHVQISYTSPWSHTISKVISYSQDQPFIVSESLIDNLIEAAQKKADEDELEMEKASQIGLSLLSRATISIMANDYKVARPLNQSVKTITLSQVSSFASTFIVEHSLKLKAELFPSLKEKLSSFMMMYYNVVADIYKDTTDYCLVDITYESTELGIVRDGILRYVTHVPVGINTLAQTIARVLDIPLSDALSFLKEPHYTHAKETLSEEKRADVSVILDEYRNNLVQLFKDTGDTLSAPKSIFIHGSHQTEEFFNEQISLAARQACGVDPIIHLVTSGILTNRYTKEARKSLLTRSSDTAMLVAAQFFHKQHVSNSIV